MFMFVTTLVFIFTIKYTNALQQSNTQMHWKNEIHKCIRKMKYTNALQQLKYANTYYTHCTQLFEVIFHKIEEAKIEYKERATEISKGLAVFNAL